VGQFKKDVLDMTDSVQKYSKILLDQKIKKQEDWKKVKNKLKFELNDNGTLSEHLMASQRYY
jgi:hypothetical protein